MGLRELNLELADVDCSPSTWCCGGEYSVNYYFFTMAGTPYYSFHYSVCRYNSLQCIRNITGEMKFGEQELYLTYHEVKGTQSSQHYNGPGPGSYPCDTIQSYNKVSSLSFSVLCRAVTDRRINSGWYNLFPIGINFVICLLLLQYFLSTELLFDSIIIVS